MRQVYSDPKKLLDLLKKQRPELGFKPAVDHLFGFNPERGKTIKIAGRELIYISRDSKTVSFLPVEWRDQLAKSQIRWAGCENWRAGLPLVAFIEISRHSTDSTGELKVNAEVGPVADHQLRKKVINAIGNLALERNLEKVQFHAGALDKGRLYSRFLHGNSIVVSNIYDPKENEKTIIELVQAFGHEFDAVTAAIPQFSEAF